MEKSRARRIAVAITIAALAVTVPAGAAAAAPTHGTAAPSQVSELRVAATKQIKRYTPKVSGTLAAGHTLTAKVGSYSPSSAKAGYQWYRNGSKVAGATKSTYALTSKDVGARLKVNVTLSRSGYATSTKSSATTSIVKHGTISWSTPALSSNPVVGRSLSLKTGTVRPSVATASYQWLRNGHAISGATKSTYVPTAADLDARLSVRVTRKANGYTSATKTSSASAPVVTAAPVLTANGTYRVGTDIAPGTYYTTIPSGELCYWERASNASGDFDAVLANAIGTGKMYVTIAATDRYFSTFDCGSWRPAPKAGPVATTIPASGGMFAVGIDIAPGTYRTTGATDGCYWERLSGASGEFEDVIANDYIDGTATVYVDIDSTDAYFNTDTCGTWTRVSS